MSNDLSFGPFRLDLDRRALLRDGSPIALGGRALDLLCALAAAGGQVVTKDALMEQVWPGLAVEENNIQVQISALRRILREAGCKPDYIITVPGRGYRFAVANDQKPASQGNLPVSSDRLIGRAAELADLATLMSAHRLVTLVGAGGSGKTRLALQLGADLQMRFPGGVWLAELAPLAKPELLGETVAALFDVSLQGDRPAAKVIADFLGARRLLLILDNCEHLILAAAEFTEALLAACPNIRVLTTSREALAIPGEHVYETPLLSVPPPGKVTLEQALEHSAVELFVARASSTAARFTLTDVTAGMIAKICRKLDGMPLAIELAAARLKLLSTAELLAHLDDCLKTADLWKSYRLTAASDLARCDRLEPRAFVGTGTSIVATAWCVCRQLQPAGSHGRHGRSADRHQRNLRFARKARRQIARHAAARRRSDTIPATGNDASLRP